MVAQEGKLKEREALSSVEPWGLRISNSTKLARPRKLDSFEGASDIGLG